MVYLAQREFGLTFVKRVHSQTKVTKLGVGNKNGGSEIFQGVSLKYSNQKWWFLFKIRLKNSAKQNAPLPNGLFVQAVSFESTEF